MDKKKIGRFIAERRKAAGLTQFALAERLDVSDRAVSKWETGASLPDNELALRLCRVLNINISDLFAGERIGDSCCYNKGAFETNAGCRERKGGEDVSVR